MLLFQRGRFEGDNDWQGWKYRLQTKEDPGGQHSMCPWSPSCHSTSTHTCWLMIPKCASPSGNLCESTSIHPWLWLFLGLMYFLPRPLLSDLLGSGSCLLKFYLFSMSRISPFSFSALWACLAVHFPPRPLQLYSHTGTYTCTYGCICTCTCVCTHISYEAYIKGAWEMLRNDGFHQLMYGPATSRKNGLIC